MSHPSSQKHHPLQPCPHYHHPISAIAGSQKAICPNCGFKDPCCQ